MVATEPGKHGKCHFFKKFSECLENQGKFWKIYQSGEIQGIIFGLL